MESAADMVPTLGPGRRDRTFPDPEWGPGRGSRSRARLRRAAGRHGAREAAGVDAAWPRSDEALVALQAELARTADDAVRRHPWRWPAGGATVGGCFVAFARGEAGPGSPGDRAWAGAVTWDPRPGRVVAGATVVERVPAAYAPGLLARREGPVLAAAVAALDVRPDVLLVDATGRDHPRRAGLALHLGAVTGLPTVGVTHRTLRAFSAGDPPPERGAHVPVRRGDEVVGAYVRTRTGARPVVAHPGWRTEAGTAVRVVLAASSEEARTPSPLREARHLAREARAAAGAW